MSVIRAGIPATITFWMILFATIAHADESREPAQTRNLIVSDIQIVGNKKLETEAAENRLVTKVGEAYSSENVAKDIRALFSTGFLHDVIVDLKASGRKASLTYKLVEKPTIEEILFNGNDEIDKDELLTTAELKAYEVLDVAKLNSAVIKLQKLYEEKGFFLAKITYTTEEVPGKDSLRVKFNIQENEKVTVKEIRFIGNENVPAATLKQFMETKEGGFFSFLSGSGAYKQDAFDQDVRRLSLVYFNEGYVQVRVDRPQVYVAPDKKSIYITIRVEEGDQYQVGTIDFTGDLLFSNEELFKSIELKEGETFSSQRLTQDLQTLQAKYGDLGYAYVNPIPRTRFDTANRKVLVTFDIDKGPKVFIGRINVVGNTKTRDKVVRRELTITEGELFNETRKRESLARVRRLGFFEEVNFNQKTPPNQPDRMDIDIVVKERNTGQIQVGAGYSSFNGLVFNGQINQINLLGKGLRLGVSVNLDQRQSLFNLNYTDPYFQDTQWSVGFDLFSTSQQRVGFKQERRGGAVRLGHPLAQDLRAFLRYKYENVDLDLNDGADGTGDPDLFPVENAAGEISSVTATVEYDKRNDRFAPSEGIYSNASLEFAGLGGTQNFVKGFANFRYYQELFWDIVWRNNITYGYITSTESGQEVPFTELYLLGGANTLRGYDFFSVGRRKFSQLEYDESIAAGNSIDEANYDALRPFGGTQEFFYNLEFQFPLIKEAGILGVVFYDIGNADNSIDLADLRSNWGFGFRWFSPIGPLRFEWGFPIARREEFDEDAVNFQFAIGTPF